MHRRCGWDLNLGLTEDSDQPPDHDQLNQVTVLVTNFDGSSIVVCERIYYTYVLKVQFKYRLGFYLFSFHKSLLEVTKCPVGFQIRNHYYKWLIFCLKVYRTEVDFFLSTLVSLVTQSS